MPVCTEEDGGGQKRAWKFLALVTEAVQDVLLLAGGGIFEGGYLCAARTVEEVGHEDPVHQECHRNGQQEEKHEVRHGLLTSHRCVFLQ